MIYSAMKRGPILWIETTRGRRKPQFGKRVDPAGLPGFVAQARRAGLHITVDERFDPSLQVH